MAGIFPCQLINMKKIFKSRPVFKDDMVEVVYTAKCAYHKEGDKDVIHRILAEKFVKKGIAKLTK